MPAKLVLNGDQIVLVYLTVKLTKMYITLVVSLEEFSPDYIVGVLAFLIYENHSSF